MGVQFAGNILVQSNGGPLPISAGGTGQTSAPLAINALLPVQAGNTGKFLTTNGTNVSWSLSAGQPAGADTQIQFNDAGSFGASSNFTINKTNGNLVATGDITAHRLNVNSDAGTNRDIAFQTAGSDRWIMSAGSEAELGANQGSNFALLSLADNGITYNIAYSVDRATRVVDFTQAPTINGVQIATGSVTIGTTSLSLGSSTTTLAGLTSVTSTTFIGALTGNASTATAVAGGAANQLVYQTGAGATSFLATANYGVVTTGATGTPVVVAGASGVLVGSTSGVPLWSTAPTLSGVNLSGTAAALSIGGNAATATSATSAATLAVGRTLSVSTDATGTSAAFNGSGNATIPLTLATVNASPQTDTFRKVTVNGKGLTTATSAVAPSDITTALGYTPVNNAGDTMTGLLLLSGDPTAAMGAVTKQYADGISSGINIHAACEVATVAPLATCTYNNGTGGVGATLTANANGPLGTVGGYAGLAITGRILVKNQVDGLQNGIYTVTNLGSPGTPWILTRATDFDGSPTSECEAGDMTFVQEGTNGGTQWVETAIGTGHNVSPAYDYIIIGTDAMVFAQFAGSGTYTTGPGIDIATNVISNTGVLSNIAGTGISVSGATGNVTVTNTGVTSVAGTAGNITVSAGTGAVTYNLATAGTAGTYGVVTTDTFGRVTAGSVITGIANGGTGTSTTPTSGQVLVGAAGGIYSPATVGSGTGITITAGSGTLSIANAGVTSTIAGTGISVSAGTGAVTITNNGVTSAIGTAGNITVSGATGAVTYNLATAGTAGTYGVVTTDTFGRVTAGSVITGIANGGTGLSTLGTANQIIGVNTGATALEYKTVTAGTAISVSNAAGAVTITNTGVTSVAGTAGNITVSAATGTVTLSLPSAVTISGLMTASSFNATSTKRVKKAVKNLSKSYLDNFSKLKPREYDRKDFVAHEFGFIAEEMELVYPEVVGHDADGKASGIDYGKLSTILTAKVQEQQTTIDKLTTQVATIMEMLKGLK